MRKMQDFGCLILITLSVTAVYTTCNVVSVCRQLIVDRRLNKAGLLKNFRAAHEPFIYEIIPEPTREGLDDLFISTSEQLTEKELESLPGRLNNPAKILILDLRSDMHGFVNGEPVQFHAGPLSKRSLGDEQDVSRQIKMCDTMYLTDRHARDISNDGIVIDVQSLCTEPDLVKRLGYDYERMPLDFTQSFDADFIDTFVKRIDTKPADTWIHIHDTDGLLSTSLLFVMTDMLKNAHRIDYKDIIMRHVAFGGIDFGLKRHAAFADFLKQFYRYALEHNGNPMLTWSEWLKNNE
jgi:hypothetical protein